MRVLIFSTAYIPLVGGAEVAVREITKRIQGVDFVLITARIKPELKPEEKIENVSVYRIGKGNWFDKIRLIFAGVKKANELGEFNVVWSIMASYSGFAALQYKKKNPKVKFLLTLQEGDSRAHIYPRALLALLIGLRFDQIFKRADQIQAISNYLAEWGKKMGATCPIKVVPNGADFNSLQLLPNSFPQMIEEIGFLFSDKIIITTSRLVKKNGISYLIESLINLPENVKLLIIGSGKLERQLKKKVDTFSLKARVVFLGEKDRLDISRYLRISNVFCRPSLSEGLGNSFLEAMYVGIPIIGTKVGGIPDFLKDGETGLFCTHDPKDIAQKIKMILDNAGLAEKLRTNGQKLVREKYSWDVVTRQMKSLFESMI